jgi:hypothetical protein
MGERSESMGQFGKERSVHVVLASISRFFVLSQENVRGVGTVGRPSDHLFFFLRTVDGRTKRVSTGRQYASGGGQDVDRTSFEDRAHNRD